MAFDGIPGMCMLLGCYAQHCIQATVAHRECLLYNSGVCHHVCFFWSTRVQRVLGGVYMAHSMTSTSGGMGHTPTKVCLRWHIVATVMRYVDNNTMHLWQCPEPAVMLFQGTVENNLSLCGCARVLVSCSIRLQCS